MPAPRRPGAHAAEPGSPPGSHAGLDDAALVRACLEGAAGAWDGFVARFAGLFRHVVDRTAARRGIALAAADRDDVVAEILVELIKGDASVLRAFAGRSSLATYLAVVARRTAVRMIDKHAGQPAPAAAPVAARDEERLRADREEIEGLIGRLDPAEARLVRLHHLEGRSYGEISRLTGLPLGSIGPALSKARRKMRGDEASESGGAPPPAAG